MNENNIKTRNLYCLSELSDFKVSDEDKDVRGWIVKDANKNTIGKVDNLLVSKANNRVVYLDVEVEKSILEENSRPYSTTTGEAEREFINEEDENHVIIPIGMAHLDTNEEIVRTPKISREIFARTKRMKKGSTIDRNYETNVLESYNRSAQTTFTDEEKNADDTSLYERAEYNRKNQGSDGVY